MRRLFGWSYPPGCSGPPEHDGVCAICGKPDDACICPECPDCGAYGDPACYEVTSGPRGTLLKRCCNVSEPPMTRTPEQIRSREETDRAIREAAEAESRFYEESEEKEA